MKTCPYCGAENHSDAPVCYICGNNLGTVPYPPAPAPSAAQSAASSAEPTQPVHTRVYRPQPGTPGPFDTQHIPYTPRNYAPQASNPPPDYGATQGYSTRAPSTTPYPPAYIPPEVYIPAPPPPPTYNPGPSRIGQVLMMGLGALLMFICGFAFWTLTYATNAGANRLRAQLATQVAGTFGGSGISLPGPVVSSDGSVNSDQPAQPTPWPTFTPAPSDPVTQDPDVQPTPNATQAVVVEKLLSEGCKTSLDTLGKLSDQAKSQPTVAFDATWRKNLSQSVADMKTNCGTLDAASPVPGLVTQAHQDLAKAQGEFDQSGKLFDEGVQKLDPSKLLEAGQHVGQAVQFLNSAMTELKKIGN
jgi:hypothetical protein